MHVRYDRGKASQKSWFLSYVILNQSPILLCICIKEFCINECNVILAVLIIVKSVVLILGMQTLSPREQSGVTPPTFFGEAKLRCYRWNTQVEIPKNSVKYRDCWKPKETRSGMFLMHTRYDRGKASQKSWFVLCECKIIIKAPYHSCNATNDSVIAIMLYIWCCIGLNLMHARPSRADFVLPDVSV